MPKYKIGDTITYSPFGGGARTVKVTAKDSNIKNGRAGFDGVLVGAGPDDCPEVWGYDDQIIRVGV